MRWVIRKVAKILEKSKPSYHGNIDYLLELECGHQRLIYYNAKVTSAEILSKKLACCQCANQKYPDDSNLNSPRQKRDSDDK